MGVEIEVRQQSSEMIRLVGGKLVKETSAQNIYMVPPKGEYQFEITGYAPPFQMKKDPKYVKEGESEFQTMTRVEFTITEGKGKGHMFTQLWGFSVGEKSNLGKFLKAMNIPVPSVGKWDLDNIVGYVGTGYVTPSDTLGTDGKAKYARLSLDTVSGVSAPEKPYRFDGEFTQAVAASNGHSNGNGNGQAASSNDGWPEG